MTPARVLAIAALTLVLAGAATAHGEDSHDDPAVLFAAGTRAYEAGDYATAIVVYEEVYRRAPLPGAEASFSDLGPAGTLAAGGDLVVVVDRHAIALFTTR